MMYRVHAMIDVVGNICAWSMLFLARLPPTPLQGLEQVVQIDINANVLHGLLVVY